MIVYAVCPPDVSIITVSFCYAATSSGSKPQFFSTLTPSFLVIKGRLSLSSLCLLASGFCFCSASCWSLSLLCSGSSASPTWPYLCKLLRCYSRCWLRSKHLYFSSSLSSLLFYSLRSLALLISLSLYFCSSLSTMSIFTRFFLNLSYLSCFISHLSRNSLTRKKGFLSSNSFFAFFL